MFSSREQLLQLTEKFTQETDTRKLLQLAEQLLDTLSQVEADKRNRREGTDSRGNYRPQPGAVNDAH